MLERQNVKGKVTPYDNLCVRWWKQHRSMVLLKLTYKVGKPWGHPVSWPERCSTILPAGRVMGKFEQVEDGSIFFQDFVLQDRRGRGQPRLGKKEKVSMEPWPVSALGVGGRGAAGRKLGRGLCID